MKLTAKQERFSIEYHRCGDASASYRIAYPKSLKWKDSSLYCESSKLLKNTKVIQRLAELNKPFLDNANITKERVLLEVARLAFSDPRKAFDENGNLLPVNDWPDEVAAAISGIETEELFEGRGESREKVGLTHKIKFWDKGKQLELAGKYLGLFVDRHELTGKDGAPLGPIPAVILGNVNLEALKCGKE
jgi:phage terminase small subunit